MQRKAAQNIYQPVIITELFNYRIVKKTQDPAIYTTVLSFIESPFRSVSLSKKHQEVL